MNAVANVIPAVRKRTPEIFDTIYDDWRNVADNAHSWLIQGVYPTGAVSVEGGAGATFKSTLFAMDILALILGRTLLPSRPVENSHSVVWLSGEDNLQISLGRLSSIADTFDIPDDEIDDAVLKNLFVIAGRANRLISRNQWGDWEPTEFFCDLKEACEKLSVSAVFIDPLRKFAGGSENSADAIGAFMQALSEFAETQQIAVILAHHLGKDNSLRGSIAIREESRCVWLRERADNVITLTCDKMNWAPMPEKPIVLRMESGEFGSYWLQEHLQNSTGVKNALVQWLTEHPDAKVTLGGLRLRKGKAAEDAISFVEAQHPGHGREDVLQAATALLKCSEIVERVSKHRNGTEVRFLALKEVAL